MSGGLESRCVGRVYGADGAVCSKSRVFYFGSTKNFGEMHTDKTRVARQQHSHCKHDPRSGSQDHHPSKISVQKTVCCNSISNVPDDGRMYPKYIELRIHQ